MHSASVHITISVRITTDVRILRSLGGDDVDGDSGEDLVGNLPETFAERSGYRRTKFFQNFPPVLVEEYVHVITCNQQNMHALSSNVKFVNN